MRLCFRICKNLVFSCPCSIDRFQGTLDTISRDTKCLFFGFCEFYEYLKFQRHSVSLLTFWGGDLLQKSASTLLLLVCLFFYWGGGGGGGNAKLKPCFSRNKIRIKLTKQFDSLNFHYKVYGQNFSEKHWFVLKSQCEKNFKSESVIIPKNTNISTLRQKKKKKSTYLPTHGWKKF